MNVSSVVMSIFVFIVLISLLSTAYVQLSSSYGITNTTNTSDFQEYFNKTAEMDSKMNETRGKIIGIGEKAPADVTNLFDITFLMIDIIEIIFSVPNIILSMMFGVMGMSGLEIPTAVMTFVLSVVTGFFVFALIAWLRKRI